MITTILQENRTTIRLALLVVLVIAAAWYGYWSGQADMAFQQERYNVAYQWCAGLPDAESCRWGAFTALNSK